MPAAPKHLPPPSPSRPRRLLGALLCAGALAGCASEGADTAALPGLPDRGLYLPAGPSAGVAGRTLAELGFDTVALSAAGTPLYLSGRSALPVRDAEDARAALRGALALAYRLGPDSDFRPAGDHRDDQGNRYLRLQQLHAGLPVAGGEVVVQTDPRGVLEAVLGQPAPELRVDPRPALGGDQALARAMRTLAREGAAPRVKVVQAPALQVLPRAPEQGGARLCYRAVVEYDGLDGHQLDEVFADAETGALLANRSRVFRALNREIYDLKQVCLRDGSELPGMPLFNEGGSSTDATAQAVYDNTGLTYWFYKHFFGRDSYDDAGARLRSSAHAKFFDGMSCTASNAAWVGEGYDQMVYGDGDGIFLGNTAKALDVTAHELTHAVTYSTSNLDYQKESGALNEAVSDILGVTVKAWKDSGGSANGNPAQITPQANTWKVGDKCTGLLMLGGALRYMNNPTQDGVSKDNYAERYMGTQDNGGVHINSGIGNLAYYLMSVGGAHPRMKSPTLVRAIGMEKAVRVFYLANTELFTKSTDFQGARFATARAAELLYGRCSREWSTVHMAWDAVGVPGTWRLCPRAPGGF